MVMHNYDDTRRVNVYRRAVRGGNKPLVSTLERANYDNAILIKNCITIKKQKTMEKRSKLQADLEKQVRRSMYNEFCNSLCEYLTRTNTGGFVGRLTYAALIAAWLKDTCNSAYSLNENLGKKLLKANPADARVKRIGVEGHYSYFVNLTNTGESDSISVLIGQWTKSWQNWFESVVQFGHYTGGEIELNSCAYKILERVGTLWSWRGKGGRTALTSEQKKAKMMEKANAGANANDILASLTAEQRAQLKALLGA